MQLTADLYKWLRGMGILQVATPKQNGNFELDQELTSQFFNGFKMYEILDKLSGPYQQSLKQQSNPTSRLYNWNLIAERLHLLKIELDGDVKQLILGGDYEMIVEVLKDIQNKYYKEQQPVRQPTPNKKPLDIDTLNSAKPLASCESVQEFIIVALSQSLQLKPRQAQQLLNNNFKLLTHVFIKGVKGIYQPIVTLLQDMYNNMGRLIELLKDEENQITYFINMLKLAFFSKESEVVSWALKLLGLLSFELSKNDLLFHAFQWCLNGGYQNLITTLQRQPQLAEVLALTLSQISQYDPKQIFGQKQYFENQKSLIDFYGLILPFVTIDLLSYNLEQIIQLALKQSESQSTRDDKSSSILLLCNSWIYYTSFFESNLQYQQQVCGILQKAAKDTSQTLRIVTIVNGFKLLDGLAKKKSSSAILVYKKLISIMIENQNEEFILRQFSNLIQKYPSIPIEMLIDGLIKFQNVNLSDAEIYQVISSHQNLKLPSAMQILEVLTRIYNASIILQSSIILSIQQITQKFIEDAEFQDFLSRITQTQLTIYISSIKQKKSQNTTLNNIYDESILNQQRRAMIINLLKYIITRKCHQMNSLMKPLLVGAYLELKNIENRENKGIVSLLSLQGNPTNIVEEVIGNDQENDSRLFLEKKIDQMSNLQDSYLQKNKSMFQKEEDLVKSLLIEEAQISQNKKDQTNKKKRNYQFDDFQCIYEEGDLVYKQQEMALIDFATEEDVDRESINISIKNFNKTFKYLFQKYAITPQQQAKNRLRQIGQDQLMLKASDIMRILQDYEIASFSTYEEILQLIQTVKQKFNYFQSQTESQLTEKKTVTSSTTKQINYQLDFEGFKKFLVQFAMIIFGRPPKDLRKIPSGFVIQEMFRFFSQVARKKSENSLIFDDPDGVTTVEDKQTIQKWNQQLLQHPNTEVPAESNLKKVQGEQLNFTYLMRRNVMINLPEPFIVCFEIVNDIIQKKFKTNIVEPTFEVKIIYEVKPIVAKGVHKDITIDHLHERQESLKNSLKMLPTEKAEMLNKSLDLSQITEDKIINKSMISKLVLESESALKQELKQMKWEKHKEYLDKQYKKIQQYREQQEEVRVMQQSQLAESKILEKSQFQPKHSSFMDQKRSLLKAHKSDPLEFKEPEKPLVSIKNSELQKSIKKDISEQTLKIKEEKKKIIETKKQQKEKQKKYMDLQKKKAAHYENVKKQKIEFNQKFQNLYKETGIQKQFKLFRKSGSMAFNHFMKMYSNPENLQKGHMELEGWVDFANTFNFDEIFDENEIIKIFTNTLKIKNHVNHLEAQAKALVFYADTGISYFEFEFCLLKCCILGEKYFNKLKGGKSKKENQDQLFIYNQEKLKEPKTKYKQQEKLMKQMENTKFLTVEAMFGYLDIPSDPNLFAGRLRALQDEEQIQPTMPRVQSVDILKIKKEQGLPEQPKPKVPDVKRPGYNGSEVISKKIEDKYYKIEKKFPFIQKNHAANKLLEEFGGKS